MGFDAFSLVHQSLCSRQKSTPSYFGNSFVLGVVCDALRRTVLCVQVTTCSRCTFALSAFSIVLLIQCEVFASSKFQRYILKCPSPT